MLGYVESQYDWARPIFLERILDRVLKRPASRKGTWPTGVNESVRGCVAILSKRIGRGPVILTLNYIRNLI